MAEINNEEEQRQIFRRNLMRYVSSSGKMQKEIADAIGVSQQTFNSWYRGIAMPRIGKIEKLANYFGCQKSDLLGEKKKPEAPDIIVPEPEDQLCLSLFKQLDEGTKLRALVYMQELIEKK